MIIKKIILQNYLCYYDLKEFELYPGLNVILGENGEGKTKLFEAIEWLFNGDNKNLELLVSAKKLTESINGDSFVVKVTMVVEQDEEIKVLTRSFIVNKKDGDDFTVNGFSFDGIEENRSGERSPIEGKLLLDRIFPSKIRRYSLFKGESELDIFKNDDALSILINSFSTAKYYEKYSEKGTFLKKAAEKAVDDATKSNTKKQQEYKALESIISKLQNSKEHIEVFINNVTTQISKTEENIQFAEKYVSNAEALDTINSRIKKLEEKIRDTADKIDENYTKNLFDEKWILLNFESIHKEYVDKITKISFVKRQLQTDFDKKIGIEEGKKIVTEELLNKSIPLPTGVPSKFHMEEMLAAEFCKVCNRPALKGSEEYNFMFKRLEAYLKTHEPIKAKDPIENVLFKNHYLGRLFNLSVSHEDNMSHLKGIRTQIEELFEFNSDRKKELEDLNEKLVKEQGEREKIIGESNKGEDTLINVLKDYTSWQNDLKSYNRELIDYEQRLKGIETQLSSEKAKKDSIDTETVNTFLIKTRAILRDIETIFVDTKEKMFDEFIELLQQKSNQYFEKINVDAFTGIIVFRKRIVSGKVNIVIELTENSSVFHKPNQSLLTSMHLSILFAISQLATEFSEESYPMIFDAPTSSFGETKTADFLNLIYETGNQKILLTKDFLNTDEVTHQLSVKKEFSNVKRDKAFWVRLERPFVKNELKTLNTQVINL